MKEYLFNFPKYGKLKLKSIWQKGKNNKGNRYLMVEESGKEIVLWIEKTDFPFDGCMQVQTEDVYADMYTSPDQIRNKVYNYYIKSDQSNKEFELEKELNEWLNSNSLFPENLNSYCHVEIDKINYKPVVYQN